MLNPVKLKKKETRIQSAGERSRDQDTETNANAEKATVVELSKVDENSKQSEQPSEIEVQTCFRCETCNFRSGTIRVGEEENTDKFAQQILNIEQLDGNVTPSSVLESSSSQEETDLENADQSENKDKEH